MGINQDCTTWMRLALDLAAQANKLQEVPIGACIIANNTCIGTGFNQTISKNNPCAHAEIQAITAAAKNYGNYRLINTTIFITLEPCLMCLGAIIQARIKTIVYGAHDTRIGIISNNMLPQFWSKANHKPEIISGVLATESSLILTEFFRKKR